MRAFEEFTSIGGEVIKVNSNVSKRYFTIITSGGKFRTDKLSQTEFDSCTSNTANDWINFLKSDDYSQI